ARLMRGNDVVGFESRVVCADGSVRWLQWNTRTMPERGVAYCVGRDVTDRRRADADLRKAERMVEASRDELRVLADEQAALRHVATLVARESPPREVFAAVAEEVGRLLRVDGTRLLRYDPGGTATIVGDWGEPEAMLVGTHVKLDPESSVRDSVASLVLRTGRPARIDDYTTVPGALGALARSLGVHSAVGTPIVVGGRLWGAMVAISRQPEPLPADAEARIGEFTELVATAISNIQVRSELAASRARIVAATDEERRRVVRDLHDGAQQRLVHTVITLKLARRALERGDATVPALVTEALDQAERATAELRELAHGILPAVLTGGGLRAGVEALASRMPLPVENDVSVGRLPAAVEATAYFVVSEALTNVAKHARAAHAEVMARIEDGTLAIQVRDDGTGGARPEGSGLVGLADRVAAVDGELRIESPADGGTLIAAAIPLAG
ncbi:MAG TPA: GAF domain-containing protein, partial [Solirubrobacteraceae bacterium]|nr:GAF domain-containing protein [Solirubrobacteraceae bacterium]